MRYANIYLNRCDLHITESLGSQDCEKYVARPFCLHISIAWVLPRLRRPLWLSLPLYWGSIWPCVGVSAIVFFSCSNSSYSWVSKFTLFHADCWRGSWPLEKRNRCNYFVFLWVERLRVEYTPLKPP